MKLTPKQIQDNWSIFLNNIEVHITSDRKQKLLDFYKKYEDRIILMPAAHKKNTIMHSQEDMLNMLTV